MASPAIEVRIAALSQALKYGEVGLDLIILQGLEDKSLQVKIAAYNLLRCQAKFKVKPKLNDFFYSFKFEVITVDDQGIANRCRVKSTQFFTEDLGDGTAIDMVYIPGDPFRMGCSYNNSAQPQHPVTIQPFFMGKYTVTQEQWKKVMENTSYFKADKRPIEQVSWNESVEFCDQLTKKTGNSYRLPSEAEWEYACRAGTITEFYFGDQITHDLVNASFGDCEDIFIYRGSGWSHPYYYPFKDSREHTLDVGQFYPNAFGLFDMHGNVWEWCSDPYHSNYNGAPSDGSSWEIGGEENQRMLRGGSWGSAYYDCRSSSRHYLSRDSGRKGIGFRVVVGLG